MWAVRRAGISCSSHIAKLLVLSAASLLLEGCNSAPPRSDKERADVVIKLTYGGQPLTSGDVDLNNLETGEGGGGPLDQTGTVKITGVVVGDYVVTVQPPAPGALPGQNTAITDDGKIAAIYRTPEKSPLKLTVHPDGGEATFDLKK